MKLASIRGVLGRESLPYFRVPEGVQVAGSREYTMGMGTLVSSYPRGLEDSSGGVMVPLGIPQPVLTPLHAWEPHAITTEGQESSASHLTFLCTGSKGKNAFNKNRDERKKEALRREAAEGAPQLTPPDTLGRAAVMDGGSGLGNGEAEVPWTQMMEAGVQTEAVAEEELDWDLSNLEDRETQTLPQNPTPFQLNRNDAFVQTDYRYLPLTAASLRPSTSLPVKGKNTIERSSKSKRLKVLLAVSPSRFATPSQHNGASDLRPIQRESVLHYNGSREALGLYRGTPARSERNKYYSQTPPQGPRYQDWGLLSHALRYCKLYQASSRPCCRTVPRTPPSILLAYHSTAERRGNVDACVQTDNDILTDEAPQFAARPPNSSKTALLSDVDFTDIDVHVLTTPDEVTTEVAQLVRYLGKQTTSDLYRLRALFRWVTENIR
ncbi:hypothetical protein E2C01_014648 [Portunus trituberculatus]|uniref:Uncharacterized protein n=1 Tax=Portunus trituberculatus TaxID=210409 RepID=A0A5B7DKJ9_PORTR|nr:hypothetical protein [Portunus trituberculatus]